MIFQLRQQLYNSQCRSVCRSVRNEFYRSVMLLIVYLSCFYCCSLDYQNILLSYFAFQLRQQLYRSQCQPVGLSVRNEFYGSVMLLLVYDCCFCCLVYNISICDSSSLSRNVGLSVSRSVCQSVCLSLCLSVCQQRVLQK